MTVFGLLLGIVGADIETGTPRFAFSLTELDDGVEIVALALGLFGIAEFMNTVNQTAPSTPNIPTSSCATCGPRRPISRQAFWPMWRGTWIGSLCALIPGTGPTIASFVSYAVRRRSRRRRNASATVRSKASPAGASTHSRCRATSSRP